VTACTHAAIAHKRPGDWCPWACGTRLTVDHIRAANAWHERPQVATVPGGGAPVPRVGAPQGPAIAAETLDVTRVSGTDHGHTTAALEGLPGSLFDSGISAALIDAPRARRSDPSTSHGAAAVARTRAADRRRAVLLAHANAHDGLTGEELATVLREPYSTVGPRRPSLVADGLLVHMPFDSRPNVAGNPMDVYRVTAKGRMEAARLSAGAA
jgi:hypothetical protein